MEFNYYLPTRIVFGRGALEKNAATIALGKRAFIVTGKSSGRVSGALGDAIEALEKCGAEYDVFEGIGNNPELEQCYDSGTAARRIKADFIVGIGGGSPLDASKAVAAFAANDMTPDDIFKNTFENGVLPIFAIPTTSGTGSEVTPWSVMTYHKMRTKRSFGCTLTFPRVALLDPKYTDSLPLDVTRSTSMDAFEHCFESVISKKASPFTDAGNFYALGEFGKLMKQLEDGEVDSLRDMMMLISMIGGTTIAHTGTTLMHAMGYPLTYFHGIPHGTANAMVMPVYMKVVRRFKPERLNAALSALGMSYGELEAYLMRNYPLTVHPDDADVDLWAEQAAVQGATLNTGIPCDKESLKEIFAMLK